MGKDSIYVQTQDRLEPKRDKKITSKQWKIYYYLLSVSKFNTEKVEDHRYVYKKDFNISACCKFLGIKSNQTFYNAIKKLSELKLVKDKGEYFLLYTKTPIDIKKEVLTNFVDYSAGIKKEGNIDLLRTYLILKRIDKLADCAEDRCFTKRELIILLGHSTQTNEMYDKVRIYLSLLSMWGFIELKYHTTYDESLGKYTIYHLQKVNDLPTNDDYILDIDGEKNNDGALSDKMKEKLHFCAGPLLEL